MKFKEFLEEVKRTNPDLDCTYGIPPVDIEGKDVEGVPMQDIYPIKLPRNLLNVLHMRLGIMGEINELTDALRKKDTVNVMEELVDILWYIGNDLNIKLRQGTLTAGEYMEFSKWEFKASVQVTNGGWGTVYSMAYGSMNAIIYNASKLIDLAKRDLAYTNAEDSNIYCPAMRYLLGAINNLAYIEDVSLEEGMDKVIAKLRKRYPKKFTVQGALNRDLAEERVILEKRVFAEEVGPDLTASKPVLEKPPLQSPQQSE